MSKDRIKLIKKINDLILEILASLKSHDEVTQNDIWELYTDNPRTDKFNYERKLVEELFQIILKLNPEHISERTIISKIIYDVLWNILQLPLDEKDIIDRLDETIVYIIDYEAFRDIDIPIVNLEIESESFRIGPVSFHSMTDEDRKDDDRNQWWKSVEGALGDSNARMSAVSFARVTSPGDIEKSIDYASNMVDEILLRTH